MTTATKPRIDEAKAEKAVGFIENLTHTQGEWAGKPFILMPWERQIIRDVFGTLNPDGTRQYRTVYIEIPRKNGKTELAAAITLLLLFADGEIGAEIYGAAADRDQAGLVFARAAEMVRQSKALSSRAKIIDSTKRIIFPKMGSFYRAIPADIRGSHGFNAHGIIFDELHVQPNRQLWVVLKKSRGARRQPLIVAITTAGYDRESICYELHDYARQVLDGTIEDPTFYACIYAAPEEADWTDEDVWYACNPALMKNGEGYNPGGPFRSIDEMREEARQAKHMPTAQNDFRRYYLNQWTQQSTRWIPMKLWDENEGDLGPGGIAAAFEMLKGKTCYGGLDLSAVKDLTAWGMLFRAEDDPEMLDVLVRFWCPEARLYDTENRYRDQYQAWAAQGFLEVTPGDVVDYDYVTKQILEDSRTYRLVDMNIDRLFQGYQVGTNLAAEGIDVVGFGMGFLSLAGPMREFERQLLALKIRHHGHPVLRWMADNVAVMTDAAANKKPDKANSQGKIDGIVALVMALDRVMRHSVESVYEERGVITIG